MANSQLMAPTQLDTELLQRLVRTVRGLAIDGVEAADSGHPGLPLGCADFAVTLWYHFLRYNPEDPKWPGRDKFILSAGHGSMLLYALLHVAGFDLPIEELKKFRQFGSKTPGHPESFMTPGVETTTGPLGQGFAVGVGFALAEKMLAARVNRDGFKPVDGYIYGLVSDGDLMEGVAMEAASFAGHLQLGNMIYLYDDNNISLDGPTDLSFGEDTAKKFQAIGWHTQTVDGFSHQQVADAIFNAQMEIRKPSLIICKTVIGFGSPNKAGTSSAHGSPLGKEEAKLTKEKLGLTQETFVVPQEDRDAWGARKAELKKLYDEWHAKFESAKKSQPEATALFDTLMKREVPADIESKLPQFDVKKDLATRSAGKAVLKALGPHVPWLIGGSADLSVSTNAVIEGGGDVKTGDFKGRQIFFGVREHAMGAICNGLTMHGGFRAYGGTFLTFSDYMRGAVRLGALQHCPSIWVWTHDSIFLGEDGPTHQPVEHVAALRTIPHLVVIRPGDAVETGHAWIAALREKRPTALILSRQNLPVYDRALPEFAAQGSLAQGAYIFRKEKNAAKLDGILMGTGSELSLCVESARKLESEGVSVRVVSMPCWELFEDQDDEYREQILPAACTARVAVEAGVSFGWHKWTGTKGEMVTRDDFGASAPAKVLAKEFGFTVENVVAKFRKAAAK
ncbi:transketolase [soil metagenome]